jgi:hypothetical protein
MKYSQKSEENMKITNKFGLPEALADFARAEKYSRGNSDISVTTLIDSPRIRLLREEHEDELEQDVSDMVWSLFGTAVHSVLEGADHDQKIVKEERLYADVAGWTLSGAIDHQELLPDGTIQITDYKVTSVWSVILGKSEWELQQNCYAWLVENSKGHEFDGRKVSSIRICAILRDWQRKKAEFDPDYPQAPVAIVDLPLMPPEELEQYVYERISVHQDAQVRRDLYDELPTCSEQDRWEKPTKWAVMKKNGKRAVKLCDSQEDAEAFIGGNDLLHIEVRPSEATRCVGNYCSIAQFCEQFSGWKK